MKYYLKKCTHQELGSINESGRPKRGRYLLTSMNENILEMFNLTIQHCFLLFPFILGKRYIATMYIIMINFMVQLQNILGMNTEFI